MFICLSQIYQSANSSEYINYMLEIFVFNFKLKIRAGKYFTWGKPVDECFFFRCYILYIGYSALA